MYNTSILVVLYNCSISKSETLNSLKNTTYENVHLVIWNNGPKEISKDVSSFINAGLSVTIKETLNNESLAKVYNMFFEIEKAKNYIILDHDSNITKTYLIDAFDVSESKIGLPCIYSLGLLRSPTINGKPISKNYDPINGRSLISAIGSGIVLGRNIVDILKESYGTVFDERFYLYGVDTTFFLRVNKVLKKGWANIITGFEHSLSRLESESEEIKNFRRTERSIDLALTCRYYTPFFLQFYYLFRLSISSFFRMVFNKDNELNYKVFILAYLSGKHYRN